MLHSGTTAICLGPPLLLADGRVGGQRSPQLRDRDRYQKPRASAAGLPIPRGAFQLRLCGDIGRCGIKTIEMSIYCIQEE